MTDCNTEPMDNDRLDYLCRLFPEGQSHAGNTVHAMRREIDRLRAENKAMAESFRQEQQRQLHAELETNSE